MKMCNSCCDCNVLDSLTQRQQCRHVRLYLCLCMIIYICVHYACSCVMHACIFEPLSFWFNNKTDCLYWSLAQRSHYNTVCHNCKEQSEHCAFLSRSLGDVIRLNMFFNQCTCFLRCFGKTSRRNLQQKLRQRKYFIGFIQHTTQSWMFTWLWAVDSKGAKISIGVKEHSASPSVTNTELQFILHSLFS